MENKEKVQPPKRVMSGMRTTGALHMGHYFGVIRNWIQLQDQYACYFGAMDWHAMTDAYRESDKIDDYTRTIIAEWIAFGIDPKKSTIFIQSRVPEVLELTMIFTNLTPMGWLDRVTTWKDSEEELKAKDAHNLGRFAYPVLQTADIALFLGDLVPIGQDQVPHLELSREIVRRFNHIYKGRLPEPQPMFTETPLVPGTDGRKMSKSYGNVLPLIESQKDLKNRLMKMQTDPARVKRTDPGDPDKCPVYTYHKLFSTEEDRVWVRAGCTTAAIGCGDCKGRLFERVDVVQANARQKKDDLLNNPAQLDQIIDEGCQKARSEAQKTLVRVRQWMSFRSGSLSL
ncbi:MAG: tryptophan--tRNA ligase [Bdellovibrionales bacterium]|nr:tryptophan--tRNA ligase [Bdellovibrionales bacterium]